MDTPSNLVVVDHPLIQHKLSWIRDKNLGPATFRALLAQIAGLMAYEATRDFKTEAVMVQTPLQSTTCRRLPTAVTIVPILRAGLQMAEGILALMPESRVGHLGMARDERTLQPVTYLRKLPADLASGPVILVDPMLATGGSAIQALTILKDAGARDLRMMCLIAAAPGVANLNARHGDVVIYAAAVDPELNDRGFIIPGLGDAGDRLYGTLAD